MQKPAYFWNLDGRTLSWRRTDSHGDPRRSREKTEIAKNSFFILPHFKIIKASINKELWDLKKQGVEEFKPRAKAVYQALRFLAGHFDLEPHKINSTRILWLAKNRSKGDGKAQSVQPLTEWLILDATSKKRPYRNSLHLATWLREKYQHHSAGKRFLRLEKNSEAIMRDAIVLFDNDWSLIPGRTRRSKGHA